MIVLAGHHPSTEADGENVRDRVIISKSVPAKVGTKLAKIDVLACFFAKFISIKFGDAIVQGHTYNLMLTSNFDFNKKYIEVALAIKRMMFILQFIMEIRKNRSTG